ncbi:MAG: aminotransferase class V-fold PLP-dependent enzyme [Candidatus Limiplasma sp.]|nr:aminotransferase class V-fold PLP-dependent enzyme [Candidatus Limiplasma sp.]
MKTPIADFVRCYQESGMARFHMPGHKGSGSLGCEGFDITEVSGADELYESGGIIAESEANAAALFGAGRTCYSTEGSSQCIRAMLRLSMLRRPDGVILAARNVHKAFVYGAALLGLEVRWLWPEETGSLCSCRISPERLEAALAELPAPPAAVYVTSPDYLGGMADVRGLAEVCHRHDTLLLVDNAHGAYLHFLEKPLHPLDLGADLCCDSAHKTLPVLTGGAYLHLSRGVPEELRREAKQALALFGSTSPSYLTLCSLDRCNAYLAGAFRQELAEWTAFLDETRQTLRQNGWQAEESDPLRLTLRAPEKMTGVMLAQRLREAGMECEYADGDHLVLMLTPQNRPEELGQLVEALGRNERPPKLPENLPLPKARQEMSIREAMLRPQERVPAEKALGRICGSPTVACPPAIPIAVSGEKIGPEATALFRRYSVESVEVVKEGK